jgi:hypothetical protein
MATRPTVGGSDGTWGTELNEHLDVSLDADGKVDDGAAQTTSAAPDADAELANKKYVDDSVKGDSPTGNDSESNAMLQAHAYLTQTSGFVSAYQNAEATGHAKGYIGTTTDPEGAGTLIVQSKITAGGAPCIYMFIPDGKYFEVTHTGTLTAITWTPLVPGGGAPVDQD